MKDVFAALLFVSFFVFSIIWSNRDSRKRGNPARDENLRAGVTPPADNVRLSRRAMGTTAWTRISGP